MLNQRILILFWVFNQPLQNTLVQFTPKDIIDHDKLYKLTSTPSKKHKIHSWQLRKKINVQKVVTENRYTCDSEIGHSINGPLPKLIKLPKASDPCEQIVLIAFLLLEIINVESKRNSIIHFDKTDPLWF